MVLSDQTHTRYGRWLKIFWEFYTWNLLRNLGKRSPGSEHTSNPLTRTSVSQFIYLHYTMAGLQPTDLMYCLQDLLSNREITVAKLNLPRPSLAGEGLPLIILCLSPGPCVSRSPMNAETAAGQRSSGHRADRVDAADDTRSELLTSYRS
jgi:hypothetical protein